MGLFRISIFVSLVSLMNILFKAEPGSPQIHKHIIRITEVSVEQILPHPAPIYDDEEMLAKSSKRHESVN